MADTATLLPPATTPLERALAQVCTQATDLQTQIRELWSPADCPVDLLPWLAWAFGIEEWDGRWTESQKRSSIAASIAIKRYRGTIGAVRHALAALGFGVEVQEWFAQIPAGDPYTYQLHLLIDQVGADLADMNRMLKLVEKSKNLRSHMQKIDLTVTTMAGPYFAAYAKVGNEVVLCNYQWATAVCNESTICM